MFNPTKDEVRRFFCETWRKTQDNEVLTPLEAIARDWMLQHPEYHDALSDSEAAQTADYDIAKGQSNPFLHLSMHLSITEQVSIDPNGPIRPRPEVAKNPAVPRPPGLPVSLGPSPAGGSLPRGPGAVAEGRSGRSRRGRFRPHRRFRRASRRR